MDPTAQTLLAISIIGFGVQQFLQVLADPVLTVLLAHLRERQARQATLRGGVIAHQAGIPPTAPVPLMAGVTDADAKKAILGLLAFFMALVIVRVAGDDLLLLRALNVQSASRGLDEFVSALTLAAGTEGANSVLKLLQYAKDVVKARKPDAA